MHHRYIGRSGLRVSPICMGTMTFGTQAEKAEAFRIMDKAYEHGINFFDTAELYPVPPTAKLAGCTNVDATRTEQLDPILDAMDLTLSDEILRACDTVHDEILYPMG